MSQRSLKWMAFHEQGRELGERQLGVDKASVIAGFIIGLLICLGVDSNALTQLGVPSWMVLVGAVATVAASTAAGMRAGIWLAQHLLAR